MSAGSDEFFLSMHIVKGKLRFLIAAVAALLVVQMNSPACTSVIVSGNATPDGRPVMWKNRDTGAKGKYSFIGVVNAGVTTPKNVWMGTYSEGFSIMNTHSYNITDAASKDEEDINGILMRMALERCASVEDFEKMMNGMPKFWSSSSAFSGQMLSAEPARIERIFG